jgi:hypothetical protein
MDKRNDAHPIADASPGIAPRARGDATLFQGVATLGRIHGLWSV